MNKNRFILIFLLSMMLLINNVWSHGVSGNASTFIISPENGEQVQSSVRIEFGINNFKIRPVGQDIHKSGHYHLLIDPVSELSMNDPIPYDEHHRHFDLGETEVVLSLSTGKHSLQLVVADEEHEPFEQLVSEIIVIKVLSDK